MSSCTNSSSLYQERSSDLASSEYSSSLSSSGVVACEHIHSASEMADKATVCDRKMGCASDTQSNILIRNRMDENQSIRQLFQNYSSEKVDASCTTGDSNSEPTHTVAIDEGPDMTINYSTTMTAAAVAQKQPPLSHSLLHQHQKHHRQMGLLQPSGTGIGGQRRRKQEEAVTDDALIASSSVGSSRSRGIFFSSRCAEEERQHHKVQKDHGNGQDNGRNSTMNINNNRSLVSNFRYVANGNETEDKSSSQPSANLAQVGRKTLSSPQINNSKSSPPNRYSHQCAPRSESNYSVNSSGSDDDGYNGSASSNDVSSGSCATSCSSPSLYESQRCDHIYNGQDHENHIPVDQVRQIHAHAHAHAPLSHSRRTMKRLKRNVSFSSDIADFSSSSTCLQDYHDDDGHDSDNDVGCGAVVGTKTTGLSSDESENNGEEYNFLLRQQKRRYQPKQQKTQRHHRRHQQQMVDTTVAMSKMRRGMKRRNEEEGNSSTWSLAHAPSLKKPLQQKLEHAQPVLSLPYSSTTALSCNDNSTCNSPSMSHPTNRIQEQQHEELKATFQSALKQLDHTIACSSGSKSSSSCHRTSSPSITAAVQQQANKVEVSASINTQVQQSRTNNKCMIKMYVDPSTTNSSTQQLKARTSASSTKHNLIYNFGTDVMACIMSYMEPEAVHAVITMPLSKTWRSAFTLPQDLWKVLCLSAPFHAKVDVVSRNHDQDIDENWLDSHHLRNPLCSNLELRRLLGRYRLLYSSFVKCLRYLNRIKDDVLNHRTPMGIEDSRCDAGAVNNDDKAPSHPFEGNSNLKHFFAKAREVRQGGHGQEDFHDEGSDMIKKKGRSYVGVEVVPRHEQAEKAKNKGKPGVKYGHSKLTQRLLGPVHQLGVAGRVNLPWSCAIYSVVNWMVAFTDVAGIQNMCLKVLPDLLEDEKLRTSAQHAGLTDIVLRAMVLFPSISELHTAAFHTLVLLARPLGGKEGMLFRRSMVKSSGIFNVGSNTGKSGIAVMLDSMKRFSSDENLQAMGCWSMVNIALIPSQKVVLVKLGGICVAANAMMQHPDSAEVHFRALFALINLVIPSENLPEKSAEAAAIREQVGGVSETSEKEMLNESVGQITNLVVVSMKNFWSSEAILNRACLVLHNLSLNENYHRVLLWTPNCYQMLEWCIGNYRHDAVLQQSAQGTLQRLQMTLANDEDLRQRFAESIKVQQQYNISS